MPARNPKTACKVVQLMVPVAVTGTVTLNNTTPNLDIDCLGFTHAVVIAYMGAAITLVGDTITVQMKETDTVGTGYANITGAAFTALTGTGDNATKIGEIDLRGRKRYLSATLTEAGTFDGVVGLMVVLLNPRDSALTAQTYDYAV